MLKNKAFVKNTDKYDDWFDKNSNAYISEIKAFQTLSISGKSIEIGVGTGKFAIPLNITTGIEPTSQMYEKAVSQGIDIIEAIAEELPIRTGTYDWTMMVTTICFVNDPKKCMSEMHRILKKGGKCAIGLVDKDSPLGAMYLAKKDKSEFYQEATFYSATDVINCMTDAGFTDIQTVQTLSSLDITQPEEPRKGHGEGGFVVVSGTKA
jgi:ubiquinone/menaquinone biosynthesis C-methylase UbiE